jgi:hypothetical protein
VAALHALNDSIVHRDIKSFNFLVDHQLNAKLADLELGANSEYGQFEIRNIDDNALFDSDFLANWIAPEVLQQAPYTQASDIYAMALVFWEIFSKEIPYSGKNNNISTRSAIINNHRPDLTHDGFLLCPEVIRNLIVAGWSHEPQVRPVADDFVSVIESAWLTHGVTGLSVLEANSKDVMSKLQVVDKILQQNEVSKSDLSRPTGQGNNSRLMSITPVHEVCDSIDNNDLWKSVRNLKESVMIVSGTYPHAFLQCSLEWEHLTGYLNENLFGYTMRDLLAPNRPTTPNAEQCNTNRDSYEAFISSIRSTNSGHCVVTIATPNRTEVIISLHASPIFKSQHGNEMSENGHRPTSWSGAVPYGRTIAFYKFTAAVLMQVDDHDADEDAQESDSNIFSRLLRKLSVDGGSSGNAGSRSNSFFSKSRGSGRSSNRASKGSGWGSRSARGGSRGGSGYIGRSFSRESRGSGVMNNNNRSTSSSTCGGDSRCVSRSYSIAEYDTGTVRDSEV